jgi:protein-tyrosine phosphatase
MIRVLFVCLGNICRSPMAEGVFAHQVAQAGLSDQFEIDSAGTSDWHKGETAHVKTLAVLKTRSIPYDGRSRPLLVTDAARFDLIVAMDKENLRDIQHLFGNVDRKPEIRLFLQDAYEAGTVPRLEVPDPYGTDLYHETYALVDEGSKALLARLRRDHGI